MEVQKLLDQWKRTLAELKPIHDTLVNGDTIDLRDDNLYLAVAFVTKIYGLNSQFDDAFIRENHLEQMVKWIDTETVKLQAAHYADKRLFYEFFQVIYPQVLYRYQQVSYRYSLSAEQRKKLIVTAEYQKYLCDLLKYYLEQQTTDKTREAMKEILSVINLYQAIDDETLVALGSEIAYMDTVSNEISRAKIVLDSHADPLCKKVSLTQMKPVLGARCNDIVCIDFSTSYFIRILEIKNREKKPSL